MKKGKFQVNELSWNKVDSIFMAQQSLSMLFYDHNKVATASNELIVFYFAISL
ncbi:hypothetical protein HYE20_00895 [Mycoplasmopsis bovis]|nr:hypothetical protein [Mycoplasmopsis bovis]QQH24519.1 hypothetical protein HYE20_00895 [Mycoplasmopsis bovis]